MKTIRLDGGCTLYGYAFGKAPAKPNEIIGEGMPACIPGNVENALMDAGLLPNVYEGTNVEKTRGFELYDWWYVKDFDVDVLPENTENVLVFDGVDTYAEYFVNGEKNVDERLGRNFNRVLLYS